MIHRLKPHPESAGSPGHDVLAAAERTDDRLAVRFELVGDVDGIVLPPASQGERRDGLWQTTCFEAFVRAFGAVGYHEFNFAPSGDWAAYSFDAYRAGMRAGSGVPAIERNGNAVDVTIDLSAYPDLAGADWHVGLSAVVEETDGTRSYWALSHPDGKPDFHDPACFTLELPAPAGS